MYDIDISLTGHFLDIKRNISTEEIKDGDVKDR